MLAKHLAQNFVKDSKQATKKFKTYEIPIARHWVQNQLNMYSRLVSGYNQIVHDDGVHLHELDDTTSKVYSLC